MDDRESKVMTNIELEVAENLADSLASEAGQVIQGLIAEVRRLQFFEVLDKTMTELAPEMEILAKGDTCAAEREQYRKQRDAAQQKLAIALKTLEEYADKVNWAYISEHDHYAFMASKDNGRKARLAIAEMEKVKV